MKIGRPLHIDPPEVVRLALVASAHMAPERALELCRNVVAALQDGVEDADDVIRAAVEHRRAAFGLPVHATRVAAIVGALVKSWNNRACGCCGSRPCVCDCASCGRGGCPGNCDEEAE